MFPPLATGNEPIGHWKTNEGVNVEVIQEESACLPLLRGLQGKTNNNILIQKQNISQETSARIKLAEISRAAALCFVFRGPQLTACSSEFMQKIRI